ncbi:hypothetical protein, partial [Bradyrhizobium neotropicale]|uniref:hypothetical protein n=1 Tax=Bradyrhizobium neotropicale TaxID=1497615 RepID=UPI001AD7924B
EKKESTGLRLSQPCQPYVTPSSISSFGRRLSSAHIAESKSVKSSGENTICQSSASRANCQASDKYRLLTVTRITTKPCKPTFLMRHGACVFTNHRALSGPVMLG